MENPLIRTPGGRTVFLEGREMMRKLSLLFAGALMGASAMSLVYGAPSSAANAAGSETYKQLAIFGDIFERVRAQYVTPPDDKSLVENAINGMLASLDPHSSYMNAEQAQDMRVQTKGEFGGLGIEVTMENDLVKVITPIDDTPAAKAGVLAGDYIAKIDGEEVRGLTLNDAVEKMRGPVNTPIKLTILRQGADKPIELTVVRDTIKVKAVKFRVENDIGYMKITSFTEKTYDDLENAIDTIKKQVPNDKLKGYVLDLRLNPGGLLDQAVSVSDAFLKRGEIVSTRGRDPKDVTRFDARPGDDIDGKPLIVLVNGGSASASEIVAGAAAYFIPSHVVLTFVLRITGHELREDPHDVVAGVLLHAAQHLSLGSQAFAAVYLLAHGVLKLWLIVGLLRERLWIFPVSVVIFALFIAYQLYRYAHTHSVWLILLSVLDLGVIALTWHEFRRIQRRGAALTR